MDKNRGQTMVELALALPCFCLGVFTAVQLICFCHNIIALQRAAFKAARQISVESPRASVSMRQNPLWGRVSPLLVRQTSLRVLNGRPFKGMASTVPSPGHFVSVRIQSQLLPGPGFGRILPMVTQIATAEAIFEPPRPPED